MKLKRNSSYLDLLPTYFMFGFAIERAGVGGTAGGRVCGEGEGEGEGDGIVFPRDPPTSSLRLIVWQKQWQVFGRRGGGQGSLGSSEILRASERRSHCDLTHQVGHRYYL